jgi:tetratricopeptide (TPR) repeat protein
VLYAGCQEEALVSYQPFVEALRHYAASGALDGAQLRLGPGSGELARLIPELGTNGGSATSDPETRRYFLFDAVAALLAEISARTPLVLVLDDLHWADRATLALLRHVVTAPRSASLLIVGTYRDAEVGAEHPLADLLADLRRERLFDRVLLPGLDADGVSELIASHAGHEAPGTLVEAVHERTEGNPFFVEEVMRHLIEVGTIFERGGRWESTGTAAAIGVPEGVKEVLARRLGRLSEQCATALAEAAVLGREFTFEVLAAMSAVGEDDLIAALEEAVAAQLVVERPGPSYAFTHALVRETLYGELSGPRRQRMHARAGAALEATHGETHIAQLALHYRLGGTAGDLEKAIDYSMQAGGRAFEDSAWDEAAAHWDGAVAVMRLAGGREGDRARLLVALGDLMVVVGDLGRQLGYLEQALDLYERAGDEERAAQVHSRLGMANSLMDSIYADHLDIGRAFRHFDSARAVLSRGAARKAGGHLEVGVSTALTYGLRVEAGMEAATRAMEVAESIGDELLWAGGAQAYAWHALASGRLSEGFASTERAWEVADRHQRPFLAFMGTNIRGQWTWGLGAPDEAEPWFERPLDRPYAGKTAYRQQIADGVGRCHVSRGEIEAARRHLPDAKPTWVTHSLRPLLDLTDGSWDAVDALAARTLATSRRTGNRWDEWAAQHLAGRVRWLRGEEEAAAELMEAALAIVVEGAAPYFELWVRIDLARVLAESGRSGAAREHVERCRAIVETGEDWRGRAGQVALSEAVLLAFEDRPDEADVAFATAHETLARHRLRLDEADALHAWGRALERAGSGPDAAEKLDRAAEAYRSCGAGAVWVERVRSPAPSSTATRRRRSPA